MKGYIVKYSTGEYDDYHVYDVAVCLTKTKAEEIKKDTDYKHTELARPVWDEDMWENINDAYYDELDNPSEETLKKYPNCFDKRRASDFKDGDEFWKIHEKKLVEQDWLLEDTVQKFYPDWSTAKVQQELRIQENYDTMQYELYNGAFIEEIEIVE